MVVIVVVINPVNHIYIYVMCAMWEYGVSPQWRYTSGDVNDNSINSVHEHQPKGG